MEEFVCYSEVVHLDVLVRFRSIGLSRGISFVQGCKVSLREHVTSPPRRNTRSVHGYVASQLKRDTR